MATAQIERLNETSAAAIFARIWDSDEAHLSPVLARQILKLRFPERDVHRMHELAAKNQERRLTDAESEEFDNYVKVGDLVAILQSKARKLLKQKPAATKRHG
jgi:hypothetical protein